MDILPDFALALDGLWLIERASTPDERDYGGLVDLQSYGDTWDGRWRMSLPDGQTQVGIAMLTGNGLFASRCSADHHAARGVSPGLSVYRATGEGHLPALWTHETTTGRVRETESRGAEGRERLAGRYTVDCVDEDGARYTLEQEIRERGRVYDIEWRRDGALAYVGVGLRWFDRLVVGWLPHLSGETPKVDVLAYSLGGAESSGRIAGSWSRLGTGAIGTEVIVPG